MKTLLGLFVVIFLAIWLCPYDKIIGPHKRLASKTPYEFVQQHVKSISPMPSECTVITSWFLIRHGTRYPGKRTMARFTEGLNELRIIYDALLGRLNNTVSPFESLNRIDYLHPVGEREMRELGSRFKTRFPELFSHAYDPKLYKFFSTQTQRTLRSMNFFTAGLFNDSSRIPKNDTSLHNVLRFYKYCPKWKNSYKSIMEDHKKLFEASPLFQKRVLESFSRRHGLNKHIDPEGISILYDVCRFGQAWNPHSLFKPWCTLFSSEEMSILEFREDLLDYWEDGTQLEVNYRPACVLLSHALDTLTQGTHKACINFSHSRAIRKLEVLLGLLDDKVPFSQGVYAQFKDNRKWRGSFAYPFGANLGFVLRQCGAKSRSVGLFLNENLIEIPGCGGSDWCDFELFIDIMRSFNNKDCNLDVLCDEGS
eukprot:TRINITY_DN1854_c0_g1_i1.p1 TRINITY_DN1854_c0_g1~~TRINITY_DN1854_c0_g1_i1.p1  ORF type:complete len:424 (-),score=18.31 TRINITY_DN1854_c0_g1_i1:73-1344(-)